MADAGDDQAVFRALASPHRRRVLDLLGGGPRTTGDLAAEFEDRSRFSVMQHLAVLEAAGLVVVRRDGRERFNHLNAVPLRRVYERWVTRLAGEAASASTALKRYVERKENHMTVRTVRIENELRIKAPPERVFAAATTEQGEWYPHTYGGERVRRVVFEERVGGLVYEDWGDGMGHLYGVISHYDPPRSFAMRGQLAGGVLMDQHFAIEPEGDESVLKGSIVCLGEISDEEAQAIRHHGDLRHYETQLRDYLETE